MKTPFKTSKTVKEYAVKYSGYNLVIPAGSTVSNQTACGNDDAYRFLQGASKLAREVTGFPSSLLAHDLAHYGLNIPAEYCEPYAN